MGLVPVAIFSASAAACSGAIFFHEEILRCLLQLRNGLARHVGLE